MATPTNDSETLRRIVNDLDTNLIVEAGAGTGKTYALVSRVVALVKAGFKMQNIVAITFTEAAAAELSERIRSRLEQLLDDDHSDNADDLLAKDLTDEARERIQKAADELDQAAIQTIHSFAAQLLRERPLDANLPPGWSTLDEVEAARHFDDKWDKWLEWALGRDTGGSQARSDLQPSLMKLIEADVNISQWRTVAKLFANNADRLSSDASIRDGNLRAVCEPYLQSANELLPECSNTSDTLYGHLIRWIKAIEAVLEVADQPLVAAKRLVDGTIDFPSARGGVARNWNIDTQMVRDVINKGRPVVSGAVHMAPLVNELIPLLHNLRQHFVLDYEAGRKAEGVATFNDLLLWARDLLRDSVSSRQLFQEKYNHILIDEFQDTDPLQAEIAYYLAAAPDADIGQEPWHALPLVAGKLFVVGDDKQSIYRFRRADIGVSHQVKGGGQLQTLTLAENRRSQQPVLDWVNTVFGELMTGEAGVQARYHALQPHTDIQHRGLGMVNTFGGEAELDADDTRRQEADHVANIIVVSAGEGMADRLEVYDKQRKCTRSANLRDVCILIRTRTGLGTLTRALEDTGIPYRLEGSSLYFDTQEVQDMLNCLRAVDDPTDAVAIVAALRSPAFACSDVDLLRWREAAGPWNYLSSLLDDTEPPSAGTASSRESLAAVPSVWNGMRTIRGYHQQRQTAGVARLISEFIRERRLDELDLAEYRPREIWRRRQFLVEQARSLEYSSAANPTDTSLTLRKFVQWVEIQQDEHARISDSAVPETDDDAVRIRTIHSAKGLEFPIVILLGLAQNASSRNEAVLFDALGGSVEVKPGAALQTPDYPALADQENDHAAAELVRLAYVAATRARDHLLVSMYQSTARGNQQNNGITVQIANLTADKRPPHSEVSVDVDADLKWNPVPADGAAPGEYDLDTWQSARKLSIDGRSRPQAVTATRLARAGAPVEVEIENKDVEPDASRPWRTGRGGTAFGSAIHGVLQDIVGRMSSLLPLSDDVPLEEFLAQWDEEIERLASSRDEVGPSRAGEIADLAKRTLRNPAVVAALRARVLWPEIPAAAQIETPSGPVVIEGIIDLLYEDFDGQLVILDYKSDRVDNEHEVAAKVNHYGMQGAVYAAAVEKATGQTVKAVQFLFIQRENGLREIENLRDLMDRIPDVIAGAT